MRRRPRIRSIIGGLTLAMLASLGLHPHTVAATDPVDEGCPLTSNPTDNSGTTLETFAAGGDGSVIYSAVSSKLELSRAAGLFRSTNLAISDTPSYVCAADFDGDGWTDFIGAGAFNTFIKLYKNRTFDNPAPDWNDPNAIRTPKFTNPYATIQTGTSTAASESAAIGGIACGDMNGDSKADFIMITRNSQTPGAPTSARLWRGNGNGTFQSPSSIVSSLSTLANTSWSNNGTALDYNGDGRKDLIFGLATSSSGGKVQVFLNNGANPPQFVAGTTLLNGAGMGYRGSHEIGYADFTGDGFKDLVVSGASTSSLRLYKGLASGALDMAYQTISFPVGSAGTLVIGDFTLDGKPDMMVGTDNYNLGCGSGSCTANTGGWVYFYRNNGTTTPFSSGVTTTVQSRSASRIDIDIGTVLDYDQDPDRTLDAVVADGNDSGNYYVFANRVVAQYVACGDVKSGVLDLGSLANEEMVLTGARLTPTMPALPAGTSITFYMSNETPENWQLANTCPGSTTDKCVTFLNPAGREIRWKATMCSNAALTLTPQLTGVSIKYDYTEAEQHLRAGVVVHDGVVYAASFKQPGSRGHFYALNAGLDTTYWDAATKLDAMADSARKMYTATLDGKTRLDFSTSNASNTSLRTTLGAASSSQASEIIAWQRSARFGLTGGSFVKQRLGSIELSTPAVLSPPQRPDWYQYATASMRAKIDAFVDAQSERPLLVFFGSKDGALHAVRNDPSAITTSSNGTEAWAFVPAGIARSLLADKTSGNVSAYPDGSPALADAVRSDGQVRTVLVMGGGNGSRAVFALDVTSTVDSSGAAIGPTPLWEVIPGDSDAGAGLTKPAIARVKIDDTDRFIAILGTGIAPENPTAPYTNGRDVIAVDVFTGTRLWRFRAVCPVTSDLITFETNDQSESGSPTLDGYTDRLVFADACGYVYKLNPAVALTGSGAADQWIDASAAGPINTATVDGAGRAVKALFSTQYTSGALGATRPIAGTMGAQEDESGRLVLLFGTGGLESYSPTAVNHFYAVYADTGAIRNRIVGQCSASGCEKFYGGVVVSSEQVFLTRAVDPPVGTTACDLGASQLDGLDVDTLAESFSSDTAHASVSALYGHAGAIYFTTVGGNIVRIGTPTATSAGGESIQGSSGGQDDGGDDDEGDGNATGALDSLGWRQVL